MGAIYGIVGDAGLDEVRQLGARLHHRGPIARAWSLTHAVHLGVRGTANAVRSMDDGIVVLDGRIDNRADIAHLLRRPPRAPVTADDDAMLVLELVATLGVDALDQLAGQFAFALWDGRDRQLVLGRDRLGYAPLYFALDRKRLIFASEYKALLAIDGLPVQPNRDAIQTIHATKWSMPGATCLAGVYPVAPGAVLTVRPNSLASTRYCQVTIRATPRDEARHVDHLRRALLDTVQRQTESYDRVGVSLGGLDSAIVAASVRLTAPATELHTFTAGYGIDDRAFVLAGLVADALDAHHHPLVLEPEDLPDLLPRMIWHLEEPVGQEDLVYLYAAAREAAKYVDLMLTGLGLDALFAGLPSHRIAHRARRQPLFRQALAELYDYAYRGVAPRSLMGRALMAWHFLGQDVPAPRVRDAEPLLPCGGFPDEDTDTSLGEFLRAGLLALPSQSAIERLYTGCGLPFGAHHTDPSFVTAAFTIPDQFKMRRGTQKYILRRAFADLLPPAMLRLERPRHRLRRDLRLSQVLDALADDLLTDDVVEARGLFEPAYVRAVRRRPASRPYRSAQVSRLWSLLLTEMWSRIFLDGCGAAPSGLAMNTEALATAVALRRSALRRDGMSVLD